MGLYAGNKFVIRNGDFIVNEGSSTGIGTTENKKITASASAAYDLFGSSVAVGSNRIVVGSIYDDVGANDNQGSAYIFDLDGNQLGIITASDGAANDVFGWSVAAGSGRIVVGANGFSSSQGAAYIYNLDGTNEVKITASDAAPGDYNLFGNSVSVGSGRIVVGSLYSDIGSNSSQGAAYMWKIDKTLSDYYDEIIDDYRY